MVRATPEGLLGGVGETSGIRKDDVLCWTGELSVNLAIDLRAKLIGLRLRGRTHLDFGYTFRRCQM